MSLWLVVPQLRSRGVVIDLAAWFPWRTPRGTPCSDSCGIFVLNKPGLYQLENGLDDLHDRDPSGILWAGAKTNWYGGFRVPAKNTDGVAADTYKVFQEEAGPGFPLTKYLPKGEAVKLQMEISLTPTLTESEIERKRRDRALPKFREIRLDVEMFQVQGKQQKGSHYPLCVMTGNPCWRSQDRLRKRAQKWREKSGREGYHHRGWDHATPQSWRDGSDTRDRYTDAVVATPESSQSYQSTPQSWQGVDMDVSRGSDHTWPQSGPGGSAQAKSDGSWKDACSPSSSRGWGVGEPSWSSSRGSHSWGNDRSTWGNNWKTSDEH
jgi:hypothetical protein